MSPLGAQSASKEIEEKHMGIDHIVLSVLSNCRDEIVCILGAHSFSESVLSRFLFFTCANSSTFLSVDRSCPEHTIMPVCVCGVSRWLRVVCCCCCCVWWLLCVVVCWLCVGCVLLLCVVVVV